MASPPTTSSFAVGILVPMAKSPVLVIRARSVLSVAKTSVPSAGENIPPSVSPGDPKVNQLDHVNAQPPIARMPPDTSNFVPGVIVPIPILFPLSNN